VAHSNEETEPGYEKYPFGPSIIVKRVKGDVITKHQWTADPDTDPNAVLHEIITEFKNGSTETTSFDGDGRPTFLPRDS
jgi:hypothetical protein